MRRGFAAALGMALWAAAAACVFGSAPLLAWVEGHRALAGDGAAAAAASWHRAMQAARLDLPYAALRRLVRWAGA